MSYMVDKPPPEDPILQRRVRDWEPKEHRPMLTLNRSAFKTYSTYDQTASPYNLMLTLRRVKPKLSGWMPVAKPRA
jgi:hypothetical protein